MFGLHHRLVRPLWVVCFWLGFAGLFPALVTAQPQFVDTSFQSSWQRADLPVAQGAAQPARSWLWGPEGFEAPNGSTEPYSQSPGGQRKVQYFDKARMEINNPATGAVTNGLLVRELISGKLASGDNTFIQRRAADDIPVAGDPSDITGPTYASFASVASLNNDHPAQAQIGAAVQTSLDRAGRVGSVEASLANLTHYSYFDPNLKHNIPQVFWDFLNQKGTIYYNGQYQSNQPVLGENSLFPWLGTVGLPLTEAYWVKATVAGQPKDVLVQAFERRILTYTHTNSPTFQVEMGNVGRHYFNWRYTSRYDTPPQLFLTGVNLAGAEFTPNNLPGSYGTDYVYPTQPEVDYFGTKGMNVFRLPFSWERLQPQPSADFKGEELERLDNFVNYASAKGAYVILDPHNYGRYYGRTLGQAGAPVTNFSDLWSRLAERYKSNSRVIFGLMNEPVNVATETWVSAANAAIQTIRASGATNLILVAGSSPTTAYGVSQVWSGTAYGQAMLGIRDPANNYAYELHQYLDSDHSGTSENCVNARIGSQRLMDFTGWLRQNKQRGFLGEFGGGRNDTCYAALDDLLSYIDNNLDVWLGWTYWAAGPLWGDYSLSLEPINGNDRPQMTVLGKHLYGIDRPTPSGGGVTPTPPSSPSSPTPTSPPPTPAPVGGSSPASYQVKYDINGSWETGYNVSVTLSNSGGTGVEGWVISWEVEQGESINTSWNASCKLVAKVISCRNLDYNAELKAGGGSQEFGIQFNTHGSKVSKPSVFVVNDISVTS
jgi:endoglucanase